MHNNQLQESEQYLRTSLAIFHEIGNRVGMITPMTLLGMTLLFGGKFKEAVENCAKCQAIYDEFGIIPNPNLPNTRTMALVNLGHNGEARRLLHSDLAYYRQINKSWESAFCLYGLGRIDLIEGDFQTALQRLEESAAMLGSMNEQLLLPETLFCLVFAQRAVGNRSKAETYLAAGLRMVLDTGPLSPMRFELPAAALLALDDGQIERAIELEAAGRQSPHIANSVWFDQLAGRPVADAAAGSPADFVRAAQERGRARDLWATAGELLRDLNQ